MSEPERKRWRWLILAIIIVLIAILLLVALWPQEEHEESEEPEEPEEPEIYASWNSGCGGIEVVDVTRGTDPGGRIVITIHYNVTIDYDSFLIDYNMTLSDGITYPNRTTIQPDDFPPGASSLIVTHTLRLPVGIDITALDIRIHT